MSIDEIISSGENITIAVKATDLVEFAENIASRIINGLNSAEKEEGYLTIDEVSSRLHVSRSALWNWNKKKYLCHIEVGGRRLYRESEVNRILQNR